MSESTKFPTSTIRQVEHIPAPPAHVYDALTVAEIHARFTGEPATSDARVGSKMTAGEDFIEGEYLELERPSRIVQTWRTSSWSDGYEASRLEFQIEPADGGTRLTMIQTLVPSDMASDFDPGWKEHYWEPMKAHFNDN